MSHENAQVTLKFVPDTIASGTTSAEIDLKGGTLCSLITPASIASTSYTIQFSDVSGGTFVTLCNPDTGTAYTGVVASSKGYTFTPAVTLGIRYIKFVFGSSETAKTFKYGLRSVD